MKKGFKILGKHMQSMFGDGMVYELNRNYTIDGYIEAGSRGYHYYESLLDCSRFCLLPYYRIFECEITGNVSNEKGNIKCTNGIKLVREISQDEIKQYILDNLDEFMSSKNFLDRRTVAVYKINLDILKNDPDDYVRYIANR